MRQILLQTLNDTMYYNYLMKAAKLYMTKALQQAAISAHLNIQNFTNGKEEKEDLSYDEKKKRVKKIDTEADTAFRTTLSGSPIEFHGIDAEGGKEAHPDKLGEAMPLSVGVFGKGKIKATFVLDVVEGTTAAAHAKPNAISVVGVSTYKSITKIPDNPETAKSYNYFRKLFAPPLFKQVISLKNTPLKNFQLIMKTAHISAKHITIVVMNRTCNEEIINHAKDLGTKLILIEAGDLLWCLKAMLSNPKHPTVMMGRGGAEEGSIAQVAAHALCATGQIQAMVEERNVISRDTTPIWNPEDYITGKRTDSSVIFTSITPTQQFNMRPIRKNKSNIFTVHTAVIDSTGFHKKLSTVKFTHHYISK